ncbi:hypothetical protein IQ268_31420 [Oculatella sp. LEGE 06141]|uniref:hypothetical protein n=1 Tax=Oculatella sp. LEGE 06141 TaxID=1828648 RepID=UPI00187FFF7D|nr:hypothetical protein [Oculatella sp. LEGE 06141]MBE9183047.1 hypothetical protein [Oculatella sp. LEGE 06141]
MKRTLIAVSLLFGWAIAISSCNQGSDGVDTPLPGEPLPGETPGAGGNPSAPPQQG